MKLFENILQTFLRTLFIPHVGKCLNRTKVIYRNFTQHSNMMLSIATQQIMLSIICQSVLKLSVLATFMHTFCCFLLYGGYWSFLAQLSLNFFINNFYNGSIGKNLKNFLRIFLRQLVGKCLNCATVFCITSLSIATFKLTWCWVLQLSPYCWVSYN